MEHPDPSKSDLMASAKLVAEAAKSQFGGESKKHDNAQLAGAAADLLNAASRYGKLEEDKGLGKYVEQAENYLHKYSTSHSSAADPGAHPPPMTTTETTHTSPPTDSDEGKSAGGYGQYMKMAEGLFNKNSGEKTDDSSSPHGGSGGYGDYVKMAEGFLKNQSGGHPSSEGGREEGHSGGGYGDYLKMAGDFLKKN